MRIPGNKFGNIANEIANIAARREALILTAFDAVESRWPSLARALLEDTGSRRRAAHWLCAHSRACGGKSPCDLLAEGDEDGVWDLWEGVGEADMSRRPSGSQLAY